MAAPIGIANNTELATSSEAQGAPGHVPNDTSDQHELVADAATEKNHHDPTKNSDGDIANSSNDEVIKEKDEKSGTSPADTLGKNSADADDADDAAEMERRDSVVMALARSYSRVSGAADDNPFLAGPDSPLNPKSANFSGREWAKAIVGLVNQDGAAFRHAGICFQNLNVHGFGASTDYQKDVSNVWISLVEMARGMLSSGGIKQRIDILRGFDGVVHQGEMLVVLGPPGSGCSTFLKTIAGETNGLYTDDNAYFNYQGISAQEMHSHHRGEAIYTAEVDVHFPQLTVGDTLTFAARARQPRELPGGLSRNAFADHLRDVVMAMFGISHTINTNVGNEFIRGKSTPSSHQQRPVRC